MRVSTRTGVLAFGLVALAACAADSPPASPAAPAEDPSMPVAASLASVTEAALVDAAERTGRSRADLKILSAEAVTWSDGSLGCPQPGMMYTQALVPGYRVRIEADGQVLDYPWCRDTASGSVRADRSWTTTPGQAGGPCCARRSGVRNPPLPVHHGPEQKHVALVAADVAGSCCPEKNTPPEGGVSSQATGGTWSFPVHPHGCRLCPDCRRHRSRSTSRRSPHRRSHSRHRRPDHAPSCPRRLPISRAASSALPARCRDVTA